jgi:hypothetical protein
MLNGKVTEQPWYTPPEYDYDPRIAGAYRGPRLRPHLCTAEGAFVMISDNNATRAELESAGWKFWFHVDGNARHHNRERPLCDYDIYHSDKPDDAGVVAIAVRDPDKEYGDAGVHSYGSFFYLLPWPYDGSVKIGYI